MRIRQHSKWMSHIAMTFANNVLSAAIGFSFCNFSNLMCDDLITYYYVSNHQFLSPAFVKFKCRDIKSHSSRCLTHRSESVKKDLTLAITIALLGVELWYLAWLFFVTSPLRWYHVVTLIVPNLLPSRGPQISDYACSCFYV